MLKFILTIAFGMLVFWGISNLFNDDEYTGYFYYASPNFDVNWKQGGLKSLDSCRSWVNAQVVRDYDGVYDYECGKNCRVSEYGIDRCETTER